MTLEIQRATPHQAAQIANVKRRVWQDEEADALYMAKVIAEPDHITHIAIEDNQVVGFVDSFLTLSQDEVRRWEVDLLAVLPEYRGRGIATRLIAESTKLGYETMGAENARGLVALDNIGSEKAFAHAHYQVEDRPYVLFVSDEQVNEDLPKPFHVYLHPVSTLNYRGVWLEGLLDLESFRAAQAIRTRYRWDTAGAVIPLDETALVKAAQDAGYTRVGTYRWWHYWGR